MTHLANFHRKAGQPAEAIRIQEEALGTMRRVLPPHQQPVPIAVNNLALCYEMTGRHEDANRLRQEQIALTESGTAKPNAVPFASTPE